MKPQTKGYVMIKDDENVITLNGIVFTYVDEDGRMGQLENGEWVDIDDYIYDQKFIDKQLKEMEKS